MAVSFREGISWLNITPGPKVSSADTTRCLAACDETMSATITVVGDSSLVTKKMVLIGWGREFGKLSPHKLRGRTGHHLLVPYVLGTCFARLVCRYEHTKVSWFQKMFLLLTFGETIQVDGQPSCLNLCAFTTMTQMDVSKKNATNMRSCGITVMVCLSNTWILKPIQSTCANSILQMPT